MAAVPMQILGFIFRTRILHLKKTFKALCHAAGPYLPALSLPGVWQMEKIAFPYETV